MISPDKHQVSATITGVVNVQRGHRENPIPNVITLEIQIDVEKLAKECFDALRYYGHRNQVTKLRQAVKGRVTSRRVATYEDLQ